MHIPHSATMISKNAMETYRIIDLTEELLKMTDRHTDAIFSIGYESIVFKESRLFCDVERFRSDSNESMAQVGMGVCYTRTSQGKLLRILTRQENETILSQEYDHHALLSRLVREKLVKHDFCLILDEHSPFCPSSSLTRRTLRCRDQTYALVPMSCIPHLGARMAAEACWKKKDYLLRSTPLFQGPLFLSSDIGRIVRFSPS